MDVEPKRTYSQNNGLFIFQPSGQNWKDNMPAIASLEELKAPQKDLLCSMSVCLKRFSLRSLGIVGSVPRTKWSLSCGVEQRSLSEAILLWAPHRLEEYL